MPSGKLQPELLEFMAYVNSNKPIQEIGAFRQMIVSMVDSMVAEEISIALIEDRVYHSAGHQLPVRIYHPCPEKTVPLIVYYHGGGHAAGSIDTHNQLCCRIAAKTQCAVMSVEYRLAPEHKFPAGLNDCIAALEHRFDLLEHLNINAKQVVVAGDSAGGNLALSVTKAMIDKGDHSIAGIALIYPSVDFTMSDAHDSLRSFADGYLLTKEKIQWYVEQYFNPDDDLKAASPLYFDHLDQFPPVYMAVAECDPLRDEGVAMAMKLKEAGVSVTLEEYSGMIHVFAQLERLVPHQVDALMNSIAGFCRKATSEWGKKN